MAKTFDNISEASATNYLFLFAQRTLVLQSEAPTPPPMNALGLPCEVMCLLRYWLRTKKVQPKNITGQALPTTEKALDGEGTRQSATAAEASPFSPPPSPSSCEVTRGEETPLVKEKTFAEKIKPLAEKITEYILDHQDDAAQEDRWRTTMKRDMAKSFREQRAEAQKVKEEVHAKMDETLQLVKKLVERSSSASTLESEAAQAEAVAAAEAAAEAAKAVAKAEAAEVVVAAAADISA
eukprot:scaffold52566_cov60-Phaeocystis_antarctica.AAC.1